jgi:phytoene dehydrogenase-like protein
MMNTNRVSHITCDALIVGAGMAGLTAAAYLSRAGLKVLLCEKEKKVGGLVNSFDYKGFVFDGGIRGIENSGIVIPMLGELGIKIDLLPNLVSIGIGRDVVEVKSKDSLIDYQRLLEKSFPDNKNDVARIIQEIRLVMQNMEVMYGIDNPLFLDLKNNLNYVLKTILPWAIKYLVTFPKIARLNKPVDDYLSGFSNNAALIDIITQHFFKKTPASFALSYFSLYLDYRYPRGGTGMLVQAMERFILENKVEIRRGTEITAIEPGKNQVIDSNGNIFQYQKLLWAANLKSLYRIIDLKSLTNLKVVRNILARQREVAGNMGGDSVFTLYLTVNLDKDYFSNISKAHFFYTPSTDGLSRARLGDLIDNNSIVPPGFINNKVHITAWLKQFLELNTFEISIPVLRDDSLAPQGRTGLIISTLFDYSLTKHIQTMGWYQEFRRLMADHMIEILDGSIYPGLKAAVIDNFTATPLTIEKISGNSEGAITGWAFTNDHMPVVNSLPGIAKSVLTPIPNIVQAGMWAYSPSGLPISILTGKLAANRILKELV